MGARFFHRNLKRMLHSPCTKDPTYKPKITEDTRFLPRLEGDLTMTYDVTSAYESNYLALVTISNNNPIGRLDNWNLTWEWERGEFIYEMKGAQTLEQDLNACFNGPAASFYQDPKFDFTQVMSCQKKPTIVDLPPQLANDTLKGKIEHCCRNGILLPSVMDSTKSKAAFQLQVFKLPPDLNRTTVYPPLNWKISGVLNPDYQCGQPRRVSPTQFPDPYGTSRVTSAIASWQVVCNITTKIGSPHCCVSFSAYYNESVVPCRTCACGCPSSIKPSCNRDKDALLLPSNALLIPFENRTLKALAWADIQHFPVSPPLPCADYCGVSINWHVYGDYRKGWSARITLFNWDNYTFADWFTAIELPKAFPGYQDVYSFNGTAVPGLNNTIFMQGKPGLNYLEAETNGTNPAVDYMVPGKQQSMISFTKKQTPGINIVEGEGFPTKVIFNGEECSLPHAFPIAAGHSVSVSMPTFLVSFMFLFLL
uniref:COBRA-like protein n=1 Tax=Araucaria cunninghamii TaxID=56994 RepID=A0A0D6QSZ5_ARACU